MTRLQNKIAIVTGAGHGIGRAISEVYAEEGAHVVMCSMNMDAGEAAAASPASAFIEHITTCAPSSA